MAVFYISFTWLDSVRRRFKYVEPKQENKELYAINHDEELID